MAIGFIGLGVMGTPMALRLAHAGRDLIVWNRTPGKCQSLRDSGARVAETPREVLETAPVVLLMLANHGAIDDVLMRGRPEFGAMVAGRTLVFMGTTSPAYSQALEADVTAAGGRYVEAPVSGSRKPAEAGQLIGMLAGAADAVADVRPILQPMCAQTFLCGAVPRALQFKLAVNLFLITMVTGLAEAAHFAERHGLELERLREILGAGPMASDVSRIKMTKLAARDYSVQASITNVALNSRLIVEAARRAGASTPLLDLSAALFSEAAALGLGASDMAAVGEAIARR